MQKIGQSDAEIHRALLQFVFYTLDRIRRYRLSREGKAKADKNRREVEEFYLKNTHQQRQEAAQVGSKIHISAFTLCQLQTRREEKTRGRKQKILEEADPERQRKLEKLEAKRENKQKLPKNATTTGINIARRAMLSYSYISRHKAQLLKLNLLKFLAQFLAVYATNIYTAATNVIFVNRIVDLFNYE